MPDQSGSVATTKVSPRRFWMAAGIVILYLIVLVVLMIFVASGAIAKENLENSMILLTSIGTLGTAAAGVVLGTQMQQAAVDSATLSAENAEARAQRADAEKKTADQRIDKKDQKIRNTLASAKDAEDDGSINLSMLKMTNIGKKEQAYVQKIEQNLMEALTI